MVVIILKFIKEEDKPIVSVQDIVFYILYTSVTSHNVCYVIFKRMIRIQERIRKQQSISPAVHISYKVTCVESKR